MTVSEWIDREAKSWCDEGLTLDGSERRAVMSFAKWLLTTAALSDQVGGWQDISTAPSNGTPIEVCNTRHPNSPPVIVRWDDDAKAEEPDPHWCDAATADGTALYYNRNYFDFWKPTTPLPAPPPSSTAGESQSG